MFILISRCHQSKIHSLARWQRPFTSIWLCLLFCSFSAFATDCSPEKQICSDGRIPAVDKSNLQNPEKWRYIPEYRIPSGGWRDRLFKTWFATPFVFSEGDIGVGGGVAITDIDFRQQRRQEFAGIFLSYTSEGQQNYSIAWKRWVNQKEAGGVRGGVFQNERDYISLNSGYENTLTRRFFGLGENSKQEDETSYLDEVTWFGGEAQFSNLLLLDEVIIKVGARAEHHDLGIGHVSTVPSMEENYPLLVNKADSYAIGWTKFGLRWDTRDSLHNPYRGWYVGSEIDWAPIQTHGNQGGIVSVTGGKVWSLPGIFHENGDSREENPPTDSLAIHAEVHSSFGDLPFWALPSLGGNLRLRGYTPNRFIDRASWLAATEYRFWILPRGLSIINDLRIERVGAAIFMEAGSVANSFSDLLYSKVQPSIGISIRIGLERAAIFRFDFGFGKQDKNFTVRFGLAF